MRKKAIALFGGSFNPPGLHHRQMAEALGRSFSDVIVIPCGPRPDKPLVNEIETSYRAVMVDLNFKDLPNVRVELFDLENATFTRATELEQLYAPHGEVWHVVGSDLLRGGKDGKSPIQESWAQGKEFWRTARFAVLSRPDAPLDPADLPPHHKLIPLEVPGSSSALRETLLQRGDARSGLHPEVAAYIERHGLYRGMPTPQFNHFRLEGRRPMLAFDENNTEARALAASLALPQHPDPNLCIVIGGDGAMLRAIRKYWRLRIPFYGINAGHMGFLLNEKMPVLNATKDYSLYQLPLLWVKAETAQGGSFTDIAFNDAWVERATGQTAWIEVAVNGSVRIARMYGDAALVSTAAGSTSYAHAMGAQPLPFNTPALLLVGSNVLRPRSWKGAVLPLESTIRFRALDPIKRPLNAFMDGVPQGNVETLEARLSRTASVELVFDPDHDPSQKLARLQFP